MGEEEEVVIEVWIANCDLDVKAQEGKGRNRGLKVESNDPHITTFHLTTQAVRFPRLWPSDQSVFFHVGLRQSVLKVKH